MGALLGKLLMALLAFPPILIVVKYLRWCGKNEEQNEPEIEEDE
jgi:hypothetical protein